MVTDQTCKEDVVGTAFCANLEESIVHRASEEYSLEMTILLGNRQVLMCNREYDNAICQQDQQRIAI